MISGAHLFIGASPRAVMDGFNYPHLSARARWPQHMVRCSRDSGAIGDAEGVPGGAPVTTGARAPPNARRSVGAADQPFGPLISARQFAHLRMADLWVIERMDERLLPRFFDFGHYGRTDFNSRSALCASTTACRLPSEIAVSAS